MTYEEFKEKYKLKDIIRTNLMTLCIQFCDNSHESYFDITWEFDEFDEFIIELKSDLSFKDYKILRYASCSFVDDSEYKKGTDTNFGYWECDVKRLYDELVERKLI